MTALVFLLFFGFAQAQLLPKGMVVSSDSIPSESVKVVPEDSAVDSIGLSLNWNAWSESVIDSVEIYQKDYRYNMGKVEQFRRLNSIAFYTGVGFLLAGVCLWASSQTNYAGKYDDAMKYGGYAMMGVGLVGAPLSFVFGGVSDTYSIRANFFKQKMIDYQKRHSVLSSEGY